MSKKHIPIISLSEIIMQSSPEPELPSAWLRPPDSAVHRSVEIYPWSSMSGLLGVYNATSGLLQYWSGLRCMMSNAGTYSAWCMAVTQFITVAYSTWFNHPILGNSSVERKHSFFYLKPVRTQVSWSAWCASVYRHRGLWYDRQGFTTHWH